MLCVGLDEGRGEDSDGDGWDEGAVGVTTMSSLGIKVNLCLSYFTSLLVYEPHSSIDSFNGPEGGKEGLTVGRIVEDDTYVGCRPIVVLGGAKAEVGWDGRKAPVPPVPSDPPLLVALLELLGLPPPLLLELPESPPPLLELPPPLELPLLILRNLRGLVNGDNNLVDDPLADEPIVSKQTLDLVSSLG